jgi:hypothetical protein
LLVRFVILGVVLSIAGLGCGKSGPQFAPVTGRITLDGKPLAKAAVAFLPKAPQGKLNASGPGSSGLTDETGTYVLYVNGDKAQTPGAVVGDHRVSIITALSGHGSSDSLLPPRELVPAKYNARTDLTFTVKPGAANQADFDLTSK